MVGTAILAASFVVRIMYLCFFWISSKTLIMAIGHLRPFLASSLLSGSDSLPAFFITKPGLLAVCCLSRPLGLLS